MADTVKIERVCVNCRAAHVLTVTAKGFAAWDLGKGAYVQDAFPELSPDERELLVSGMCPLCSAALFDDLLGPDAPDNPMVDRIATETPAMAYLSERGGAAGPTPEQCIERARLGLTAEGEPATRGHLRAPDPDWPRCSTEIPGLQSALFATAPNICNRPATLMLAFTTDYIHSMVNHRCGDADCPIAEISADSEMLARIQANHIPICAMHLPALRRSEDKFVREVGRREGVERVYELGVIGVETVSLLGGGHPEGAQVLDLRPLVEPVDGPGA
jgi:hypothetical protein